MRRGDATPGWRCLPIRECAAGRVNGGGRRAVREMGVFHRYTMAGVGAKVGAVALPYTSHPLVGGLGAVVAMKVLDRG